MAPLSSPFFQQPFSAPTGTAAEVTPIRSVDRVPVGNGRRGPITEKLQTAFFEIVSGKREDRYGWLTPVNG